MVGFKLPEGVIACNFNGENFGCYAVDAAVVARVGARYSLGNESGSNLDVRDDPRLERLKEYARNLKKNFNNPQSAAYNPNTRKREALITTLLAMRMAREYGVYSDDTRRNGHPEERAAIAEKRLPRLANMPKDSLVCRHQATVLGIALSEAGIANDIVSSRCTVVTSRNGELTPGEIKDYHLYIVTREGNAVVEATVVGGGVVYRPIKNAVTTKNIVYHGAAAYAGDSFYGGGTGDGQQRDIEKVKVGHRSTIQLYEAQKKFREAADEGTLQQLMQHAWMPHFNAGDEEFGKTALHYAVERQKSADGMKIMRYLLSQSKAPRWMPPGIRVKVDVNVRDNENNTPIHYAIAYGNREQVELLLSYGATVDEKDRLALEKIKADAQKAPRKVSHHAPLNGTGTPEFHAALAQFSSGDNPLQPATNAVAPLPTGPMHSAAAQVHA